MMGQYILEGHEPVKCDNLMDWGRWMSNNSRQVARTTVGDADISTVFLGLDHAFGNDGPPILFETMVFGGANDGDQYRYCTWNEAEAGHTRVVAELQGKLS